MYNAFKGVSWSLTKIEYKRLSVKLYDAVRKKIDVFIEILITWLTLISSFSKKNDCIRTKGEISLIFYIR